MEQRPTQVWAMTTTVVGEDLETVMTVSADLGDSNYGEEVTNKGTTETTRVIREKERKHMGFRRFLLSFFCVFYLIN